MTILASVCEFLGDEPRAARVYELLAPFGDRNALSVPDVAAGSVSRSLGVLAAATRRWEPAIRHFEDALAMNARMDARPWLARTRHDYGRALLARAAPGDRDHARELLAQARDAYHELGMTTWARRACEDGAGG
jgi:tetratricopeptide (TPR) repeat protein